MTPEPEDLTDEAVRIVGPQEVLERLQIVERNVRSLIELHIDELAAKEIVKWKSQLSS